MRMLIELSFNQHRGIIQMEIRRAICADYSRLIHLILTSLLPLSQTKQSIEAIFLNIELLYCGGVSHCS